MPEREPRRKKPTKEIYRPDPEKVIEGMRKLRLDILQDYRNRKNTDLIIDEDFLVGSKPRT